MATTVTTWDLGDGTALERTSQTSGVNAGQACATTVDNRVRELLYATVVFNAATYTSSVTITLDSGLGSTYDALLAESTTDSDADLVLVPSGVQGAGSIVGPAQVLIAPDDAVSVGVPAGGAGNSSNVAIYCILRA